MTGVNQRAMADIDMIANDCWIVMAVDMDTAIILNIGSLTNGDEIIITAQRHLMPDGAIFTNANRANNGGGLGEYRHCHQFRGDDPKKARYRHLGQPCCNPLQMVYNG